MLKYLSIHNFTIITQLDLEFQSGMTVLTGETGAGKSILIDALLLALGDRADTKMIRADQDRCSISASFEISNLPMAQQWLVNHELQQDSECILRRTISLDGRSRAFINDQAVSQQLLREFSSLLVNIHGQHEHQTLLKSEQQRALLDAYAGHLALVKLTQETYVAWRNKQNEFDNLKNNQQHRAARLDLLRYQVQELDQLSLTKESLATLDEKHRELANADTSVKKAEQIIAWLADPNQENISELLTKSQALLSNSKETPAFFKTVGELLENALIQIKEAVNELTHYMDTFEANPKRLLEIEQQLATIHDLARKHRVSPEELPNLHQTLLRELTQLENSDVACEHLATEISQLANNYQQHAKELSMKRQQAGRTLASKIEKILHELGLPGGKFVIQQITNEQWSPNGLEKIDFHVCLNPGQPLQPLAKVASGGELSRISLAIHVLTAQKDATPTLIFDEVDTGIGGGTAETVGRLLHKLGKNAQVLCVTHLAQVAALSHHHLRVEKIIQQKNTQTEVRVLDKNAKITEIARMLGGVKITDQTLAHAREMLEATL